MKPQFHVGDRVRVKTREEMLEGKEDLGCSIYFNKSLCWVNQMNYMCGSELTIKKVEQYKDEYVYRTEEELEDRDDRHWYLTDNMLRPVDLVLDFDPETVAAIDAILTPPDKFPTL